MALLDDLLKQDPAVLADTVRKIKVWKKNRDEFYNDRDAVINDNIDFIKGLKAQSGMSAGKTLNKVFSIPLDVYMSNQHYWDEIIATKQFKKHPEWMVGK